MGRGFQNLVSFGCPGPFIHDANTLNSPALTGAGGGSGNHPQRDTLRPGGDRSAGLEKVGEGRGGEGAASLGRGREPQGRAGGGLVSPRSAALLLTLWPLVQRISEQPGNWFSWIKLLK